MAWPVNTSIPHLGWQPGLTASYRSIRDRCEWRSRVALQQVQLIPSHEPRRVARAPVAGEAAQLYDRAAVGPAGSGDIEI